MPLPIENSRSTCQLVNSEGVVGHNATLKVIRAVVYVKDRALLSTLVASVDKVLESELDAPRRTRAERVKKSLSG